MKLIFFSQYFAPLARAIKFWLVVFFRFIRLIFKGDRRLQKEYLTIENKHLFTNSHIVLKYRFRNAIWYELKGHFKTLNRQGIILNHEVVNSPIVVVVHGFLQKKREIIHFESKRSLVSNSFRTKVDVNEVAKLKVRPDVIVIKEYPQSVSHTPVKISQSKLTLKHNSPKINFSHFNKDEFYEA